MYERYIETLVVATTFFCRQYLWVWHICTRLLVFGHFAVFDPFVLMAADRVEEAPYEAHAFARIGQEVEVDDTFDVAEQWSLWYGSRNWKTKVKS